MPASLQLLDPVGGLDPYFELASDHRRQPVDGASRVDGRVREHFDDLDFVDNHRALAALDVAAGGRKAPQKCSDGVLDTHQGSRRRPNQQHAQPDSMSSCVAVGSESEFRGVFQDVIQHAFPNRVGQNSRAQVSQPAQSDDDRAALVCEMLVEGVWRRQRRVHRSHGSGINAETMPLGEQTIELLI